MRLYFTPTSASWRDFVECRFALLTTRRLARGAFRSTRALARAIKSHIAATNAGPKPFVWTMPADEILESGAGYGQPTTNSRARY